MINRSKLKSSIKIALNRSPIALLIGPRQCGKTTIARQFVSTDSLNYFDLEDPVSLARLDEPMTALRSLEGLVVIDEVQLRPDLFPVLRVLADRELQSAKFLILGSASGDLLRQTSESLAGRVERIVMDGISLAESINSNIELDRLWLRGGFPNSLLAETDVNSYVWRENYIRSLLERDLPNWGIRVPAATLRRFWNMLAHYHGQVWNAGEPAKSLGVSQPTVRRYLDILTDAFMVRQLQPYYANIKKRQVKSPKIYINDNGLLHALLGIKTASDLVGHPKMGSSWEGYAISQLLHSVPHDEAYFWATHQGAELDLVIRQGDDLRGFEIKRVDAPRMTRSIRNALEDLTLKSVTIIYPGEKAYPLSDQVTVKPLAEAIESLNARNMTRDPLINLAVKP